MPRLGRGAHYSAARGAVEWTLATAYRSQWPARLVRKLGLQRRVVEVRHRIATSRWPRGTPSLRIGFVSDLHAGPTTHPTLLDEAFALLAAAKPDLVLLGGDYVFLSADYIDAIASRVRRLAPPLGIYSVMGNHDLWADDAAIAAALTDAGARVLVNEQLELPAPFSHVVLAGLDDPWTGRSPRLPLFAPDDERTRIVLVHAPEAMLHLRDEPFELAMCGHTHGGHIALPGHVPVVVPGPLSRRYAHGRHDVGNGRTLLVSRGVGASEVALRTFADPDVLIVDVGSNRGSSKPATKRDAVAAGHDLGLRCRVVQHEAEHGGGRESESDAARDPRDQ